MTEEELEKKAFEYIKEQELVPYTELDYPDDIYLYITVGDIDRAFVAGAKLMQKELEEQKQCLAKRICELQSDLAKEKSKNETTIKELEKEKCELLSLIKAKDKLIEKMKRFCSCEFCCHFDEEYTTEEGKTICELCENNPKWELAV